ncbi:hypothetical protein HAX54_036093 [Datura stramonium]|uniref:Pentatricopeptide repeat-containing protein n=1 Tax=Datura stramonium TaxID=4076 RepID=A0ABS8VJB0_DATST|nr:hypothetical protein [Datura stramonium]
MARETAPNLVTGDELKCKPRKHGKIDEMLEAGKVREATRFFVIREEKKCSEEGEIEDACRLFHDMIEKGVVPGMPLHILQSQRALSQKDLKVSLEVFNKCAMQDPTLYISWLLAFILSLCKEVVQGKSPLMHQALSNEILASISSSSKPDPIFKLFQVMQENRLGSNNVFGKEMAYR